MKGLSSTERAQALIGLAHPQFRDELNARGWLSIADILLMIRMTLRPDRRLVAASLNFYADVLGFWQLDKPAQPPR